MLLRFQNGISTPARNPQHPTALQQSPTIRLMNLWLQPSRTARRPQPGLKRPSLTTATEPVDLRRSPESLSMMTPTTVFPTSLAEIQPQSRDSSPEAATPP